jgi:hypothetical protein
MMQQQGCSRENESQVGGYRIGIRSDLDVAAFSLKATQAIIDANHVFETRRKLGK